MFSSHTQTKGNCGVIKVLTNIMVISSYYIYKKSLIYIVHLKVTQYFCQLSLSKARWGVECGFENKDFTSYPHFFFLKILFIYLRENEWERAWERRRSGGEADSPRSWEPDAGLDPESLGSWPEPKAVVQPTEPPRRPIFSFKGLVVVGRQTSGIWGQMDERVLAKQSR